MKKYILMIMCGVLLSACGIKSPYEDSRAQIEVLDKEGVFHTIDPKSYALKLQSEMVSDCKALQRETDQKNWEAIGTLSGPEKLTAIVSNQWKEAFVSVNGKDFCTPGTNEFDAAVAYYSSIGKVYSMVIKETGSTLRFAAGAGFGYLAVDSLASAIGDRIAGDQVNAGHNATKATDEAVVNSTSSTSFQEDHQTSSQISTDNSNITPSKEFKEPEVEEIPIEEPLVE